MKWVAPDKQDLDYGYKITPKQKTFNKIDGYIHPCGSFVYGQEAYCYRYSSNNKESLKALIFRDSFANFGFDFFPEVFSETLYIWDSWQYKFNKDIVDIEKPDIVIYTLYEGYINRILMEPSFVEYITNYTDVQ